MMTVTTLLRALVEELAAGDVPQPLTQRFTLGLLWADLARLAEEPLPPDVAALLDMPIPLPPTRHERWLAPASPPSAGPGGPRS